MPDDPMITFAAAVLFLTLLGLTVAACAAPGQLAHEFRQWRERRAQERLGDETVLAIEAADTEYIEAWLAEHAEIVTVPRMLELER